MLDFSGRFKNHAHNVLDRFYRVDAVTALLCRRQHAGHVSERACLAELGWLRWPVAWAGSGPSSPPRCTLPLASLLVPWGRPRHAVLGSALPDTIVVRSGAVASHGHSRRRQHVEVSSASCHHIACAHAACVASPLPLLRAPTAPAHGRVAVGFPIKELWSHELC